ncbi:RING finger domain-containing protein, partial [Hamiltosporidium magnivora]
TEINICSGLQKEFQGKIQIFRPTNENDFYTENLTSNTVCIVALPNYFKYSDLENFIQGFIPCYIRYFKNIDKNCFLVILKFETLEESSSFYKKFNGKLFNEYEPEICHVMFLGKIQCMINGIYTSLDDITTVEKDKAKMENKEIKDFELPNCPVCLERLDLSISGVLTIQCNHSFHCNCLFSWNDLTCPVCRYSYSREGLKCSECDIDTDLWACLICGNLGCGRYNNGHANKHFKEFDHFFSLELNTKRVWDYVSDNYVHRIVQSINEGKLVQVDGNIEKAEDIKNEYENLLIAQMESQRIFYESKIKDFKKKIYKKIKILKKKYKTQKKIKKEIQNNLNVQTDLQTKNTILSNENNRLLEKNQKFITEIKSKDILITKLQRSVNEMTNKIEKDKFSLKEMQDEIKELYFHIEKGETLKKEMVGGSLIIRKGKKHTSYKKL